MKSVCIKLFLLFAFLFATCFIETLFVKNSLLPVYEHISALKQTDKTFLRTEQDIPDDIHALFVERSQIRIHKTLHETEDKVFKCEQSSNTNCYVSSIALNAISDNDFLKKCVLKGELPKDSKSVAINENLAKLLNYSIGDEICIKSAILYEVVQISGIIRNFYGFPDFKADANFYIIMNRGFDYQSSVIGNYYDFSDNPENAFLAENVVQKVKSGLVKIIGKIISIFFVLVVFHIIAFYFYKKILFLRQYRLRLYDLGKTKLFIEKERIREIGTFSIICFAIMLFATVLCGELIMIAFNSSALLFFLILNYFWSK